ncbi:MAG: hypothetical protein Q9215_004587 [Flavoplaca cf. flavocitrina]
MTPHWNGMSAEGLKMNGLAELLAADMKLNTQPSTATPLFDEISEMYLLAHNKSNGSHSTNASLEREAMSSIGHLQDQSPDPCYTSHADRQQPNIDPEALSLPQGEDPQSFQFTLDDTLDTSHLDNIFLGMGASSLC